MEDGFSLRDSTVGIFGMGLMGGSLALALKGYCSRLIGFDSESSTLELALSNQILDQAETSLVKSLPAVDVLVLATPVPVILKLIQQLPALISSPCIVVDIGSTKTDILEAMANLPECFEPIGGHPICGKEKLGLENADKNLYQGAPFVVTPLERTTRKAKSAITQIISAIGAHRIEMSAADHDRILASMSHLPFLISSALAHATPWEFAPLAGPGFRSTSRLAGTPSAMMMGILQSNRGNILNALRSFREMLTQLESALEHENYSQLELLLNQSHRSYYSIVEN
jgi:prephenate dehydrogenase